MRPYVATISCIVAVCLVSMFSLAVTAQEGYPTAGVLKLTKLKTTGFSYPFTRMDFVGTGKKDLVLFCGDVDPNTFACSIRTIMMKLKGKVISSGDAFKTALAGGDEGVVFSAFWIGNDKSGYGLLFVFYVVDENCDQLKLDVAEFDSEGKMTGSFRNILTLKPPNNNLFSTLDMGVDMSDERFGIALGTSTYQGDNPYVGQCYFLETDLHGKAIGKKRTVAMPNGGRLRVCNEMSAPAWNGKQWMIPLKITKSEEYSGGGTVRSGAMLMVVPVTGRSGQLKPNTIYDMTSTENYLTALHFLSGQPEAGTPGKPAKAGSSLYLVAQLEQGIPLEEREIDSDVYSYYLQKVSPKGKKSGGPEQLAVPAWNRSTVYTKYNTYHIDEKMSPPVQKSGDQFAFAITRSLEEYVYGGGQFQYSRYEHEIDLISIDRVTGVTALLAGVNNNIPGVFYSPRVKLVKGKLSLVTFMYGRTTSGGGTIGGYYYSRY